MSGYPVHQDFGSLRACWRRLMAYINMCVNELGCPRCAAVVAVSKSASVCSNCGYDFSRPTARIRMVAVQDLWLIFLMPFAVAVMRKGVVVSAIVAVFVLLAVGFSLTEKMRQSLSLNAPKVHVPISMSKPELPTDWEPIARLPRPRTVYLPPTAKVWSVLGSAGLVVGMGLVTYTLWKNSAVTMQGRSVPRLIWDNRFVLVWLVAFVSIGAANVRSFLIEREVLREGELTSGVLTDWSKGRRGIWVKYQFWVSSGQRFEGTAKVNSRWDPAASSGVFPVFYLSHEPKRNVALCCTNLRITGNRLAR